MDPSYPHQNNPCGFITWLLDRLRDIPDIDWDDSAPIYHSSRDEWHVRGWRRQAAQSPSYSNGSHSPTTPNRSSPTSSSRPSTPRQRSHDAYPFHSSSVIARISNRSLRLERQYQLARSIGKTSDPKCKYHVRALQILRLQPRHDGDQLLTVILFEDPGYNYLWDMVNYGANWYALTKESRDAPTFDPSRTASGDNETGKVHLPIFLDIAIGASSCIEMLHQDQHVIHSEVRGDSFHFDRTTGAVRLVNVGAGSRSVENQLQSGAWTSLSKERGVDYKLHFIAPEQTGRLQATPDVRTDIYRLGLFFWNMLAGDLPFSGRTPLEIIQNVFSGQVPPISSRRYDVPDALSAVIQRMTAKNIEDRYSSITGLKWDLTRIQQLLSEGESDGLRSFVVGEKDLNTFFCLPNIQIGRDKEKQAILDVIERVSVEKQSGFSRPLKAFASTSSDDGSSGRPGNTSAVDMESASEFGSVPSRQNSRVEGMRNFSANGDISPSRSPSMNGSRPVTATYRMSNDVGLMSNGSDSASRTLPGSATSDSRDIFTRSLSKRTRRRGACELVTISGAAGLGKSSLVSSVMSKARNKGYTAAAKFDRVKPTPFEPCLKLLSSIIQQIFSEPDVTTEFHEALSLYLRQVWPLLSGMLGLPHWLLEKAQTETHGERKFSVPGDSVSQKIQTPSQKAADFFRYGTCARTSRFIGIYLDVLRFIAERKFVFLCLDYLQYADEESTNLIESLISSKIQMILVVSFRDKDKLPSRLQPAIQSRAATNTRVELLPLSEDQTADYVAATLQRSKDYCFSLVAVVHERTHGNPFFIREMLETCHRTGCLWFSFEQSGWTYSLDRIFAQFETPEYNIRPTNDHLKNRILELSSGSVTLLKWASLLGSTFNFDTVKLLLDQQDHHLDSRRSRDMPLHPNARHMGKADLIRRSSQEAVRALQEAIAAYILEADEGDKQLRWCHERYLQSAMSLCDDAEQMHFRIAEIMISNLDNQDHSDYIKAVHICESVHVIQTQVGQRNIYRKILFDAAKNAMDSGGRKAGLEYLSNCLLLLQPDPWDDEAEDVDYEETLHVYTRTAECYFHQGCMNSASELINTIFKNARDAVDKVPSFVLKSRISSEQGDNIGAFEILKQCLSALGLDVPKTTWADCDRKFHELRFELQKKDLFQLSDRPLSDCRVLTMRGSVLCDTIAASFWADSLLFYQLSLLEVELNLRHNPLTQAGLAYIHLAACAIGRFDMVTFGCEMADFGQELLRKYHFDGYTHGRGEAIYSILIGHLQQPMESLQYNLSQALERSLSVGDMMIALLNVGFTASVKIWSSEDLAEVETYCNEGAREIRQWQDDIRGGLFITAASQYARAMQGKTRTNIPEHVLSDQGHDSVEYIEYVKSKANRVERSLATYRYYQLTTQYSFGHYQAVIETGSQLEMHLTDFWSSRFVVLVPFYICMARFAIAFEKQASSPVDRDALLEDARKAKSRLEAWSTVNDINYAVFTHLLGAHIAENECRYDICVQEYEAAQDASELRSSHLDYALATELSAEFLIRRGARRLARGSLSDAIASYRRVSAFAKANQIHGKYEYLLRGCANLNSADAVCQTIDSEFPLRAAPIDPEAEASELPPTTAAGHVSRGSDSTQPFQTDAAALGLDVLDLQSILNSSQILASELNPDRLIESITKIIIDSTDAGVCGLVQKNEDGVWIVSSVTITKLGETKKNMTLDQVPNVGALSLVMTSIRFRETIFIPNVFEQTRFNISQDDLQHFREDKAVIVQPILRGEKEAQGAIFVHSRSFTQRNATFLQLLVNSFSTAIINSRLFKEVEKASANNAVMVEAQKHALAKAQRSEHKAKIAEAEAMRNVKLKEEAAKAKSMFLANVSHELRTPLNGVIGMSELLKGSTLSAEQESYADSIRVCADTLLTVINDILDYSKLEAGKMQMFSVALSLHQTIHEVVRVLSYSNHEKGLRTVVDLDLHPEALVMGDPVRIHQILMNLMSNSYKFTSEGSVTVSAFVDSESDDEATVTFSVADTGVGISETQKKKLFLPFSQADNSTARSFGGTGLGLSICKAIIEGVMKGKIWMESEMNKGTKVSFTLTFPKAPDSKGSIRFNASNGASEERARAKSNTTDPMAIYSPPEEDSSNDKRRHSNTGAPPPPKLDHIPREELKVLVAEDNPTNQKIAIAYVKKLGYKCSAYNDGRQAVDALHAASKEGNPFHMVLMDCQMPVLDGYDATREIRKSTDQRVRNILVIAMTASAIPGDREKCLDSGMNSYLAKPVRQNVLKGMLDSWIVSPDSAAKEAEAEVQTESGTDDKSRNAKENRFVNGKMEMTDRT